VSNGHALFALDRYHIWLGTDGGQIYFSNDGGLTWTIQEAAAISATDIVAISFATPDIGFAGYTGGEVARTADGSQTGASWAAVTSTAVAGMRDLHAISQFFIWVVGTGGMYYSHDAGVTWDTRNTLVIAAVDFLNELEGIAVVETASGSIYHTINGGNDWAALTDITNGGYLDVAMINSKLAYVAGVASGGTGMLARLLPEV
jgi:L-ascorbate metabolism protein UlaG (beta-lactamase superfamily)